MRELSVYTEICGRSIYVGQIVGNDSSDACFSYADEYLDNPEHLPISLSLPLDSKIFTADQTRIFFEGLLPEGFTRRCVAEWIQVDEHDYLSILAGLGHECLGAVKILDENAHKVPSEYRKLTQEEVKNLAREGATESAQLVTKAHLSLTGASGKVGLYYNEKEEQWYLPVGNMPSTHIVKQSHIRLKRIVANEQLCLLTGKYLGIEIPESFIINTGGADDADVLFATKRYDRKIFPKAHTMNGLPVPYRLHQEDFAQALGIPAANKYEKNQDGYMKKLFDLIRNYSSDPIADQLKLWDICVFNVLIGNTDNHIKNLSLLYGEDLKSVRLAPAYDIISTMVYESSTENMALSINGIYNLYDVNREALQEQAHQVGLGVKMAMKRFDRMVNGFEKALNKAKKELTDQGFPYMDSICEQVLKKGGINQFLK